LLSVVGIYGVMRVLETTFVGLMDERPPHWIVEGKEVPLPTSLTERLAFAIDLCTSLRGNSWFSKTHWDWAPEALVNSEVSLMSRTQFLRSNAIAILLQYLAYDMLETLHKLWRWESTPHFITRLPWQEQLSLSASVCCEIYLSMNFPYTLISCAFVLLGSFPENWPPLFNAPIMACSLADFWTKRWHATYRRVFHRLSKAILCVLPISHPSPSWAPRIIRSVVIFGLSALFHVLVMYRADMLQADRPRMLMDPSIIKFFLLQPFGLALENFVVLPACKLFVPVGWRSTISRIWVWTFMLWSGRFWSDVWISRGFWDEKWNVARLSVVRGLLFGKFKE